MRVSGIGRVIFWAGGSLWIGQAFGDFEPHAHHAIQISIGLSDGVAFRAGAEAALVSYGAAFIPPDFMHTLQASGRMLANLFCEPESALGRGLLDRFGRTRIVALPPAAIAPHAEALGDAFGEGSPDEELEALALDLLYALAGGAPARTVDPRIARATEVIAARLAQPLSLADVAGEVGLSPSRLRHLFVAETGVSFRAYLLWTRLNRALELGFSGTPWTEAAHATHFADSAHLSRTARRMYGLAPSSIRQDLPAAARPMTA